MKKIMASIKFKMIAMPLLAILVGNSILGVMSADILKNRLIAETNQKGYETLSHTVRTLETNEKALAMTKDIVDSKIRATGNLVIGDSGLSNERLMSLAKDLDANEINYINSNGEIIYSSIDEYVGWTAPSDHPIKTFISGPLNFLSEDIRQDTESGEYKKYGYIRGRDGYIVQVGIDADEIYKIEESFSYQTLVDALAEEENVIYALYISKDLKAVAHSNHERIGIILDDEGSIAAAQNNEPYSGEFFYTAESTNVYDMLIPLIINGDHIGALNLGYSMEPIEKSVEQVQNIILLISILIFALVAIVIFVMSNRVINGLSFMNKNIENMSNGDFSVETDEKILKRRDEIGEISKNLENMRKSVKEALEDVLNKSISSANASNILSKVAKQSSESAEEVSKTINEIAQGASDQAADTEKTALNMEEMGRLIENDISLIKLLNEEAKEIEERKEEGFAILKKLIEKTEDSEKISKEVSDIINKNNESAEKIEVASSMIQSISDQTNLLALNAAIEAARAGEAGRGFAVVADEIRKLAEQSNSFTKDIKEVISDLKDKSQGAVSIMKESREIVGIQGESVKDTREKFEDIAKSIEKINESISNLNISASEMKKGKDEVSSLIENLSAISEENAASTEEASASMQEQTASIEELSASSEELSQIAKDLKELVEKFKI